MWSKNTLMLALLLPVPILSQTTPADETRRPNRLIHENSPYLRQHAFNPVDWYPWGEEAFAKARKLDRPIFLSIGYSTCHWCHVMERESFSNPTTAALMNANFVSIKVDREERPDIDKVYMSFVQLSTGSGGWPLSVFLTPDLKPFFGGTYFPGDDSRGMVSFPTLLEKVGQEWKRNKAAITGAAERILTSLKDSTRVAASKEALEASAMEAAYKQYAGRFDPQEAGFGRAPKFPRPVNFAFLLRDYRRNGRRQSLDMTLRTLRAMAKGGMRDQLGGGFHRYSTDRRWFLPHFEKMLYDQAQLAVAYLEAFQITGQEDLAKTARGILDDVLREMTGTEGGFHSAHDADSPLPGDPSQHAEGAFYVWTRTEIEEALAGLPAPSFPAFIHRYGVRAEGNVKRDPFGEFHSKNVLYQAASLEETAARFSTRPAVMRRLLKRARLRLLERRNKRPRPGLDDKVLTAWNGLMISALAKAGRVLAEPRYLTAAQRCARLIGTKLSDPKKQRLMRRYRNGHAEIPGQLSDYAFLIQGLLDLHEADLDPQHVLWAERLMTTQLDLFGDSAAGGFYNVSGEDPTVLFRVKEDYDGAEPSPNSVSALNLLRLASLTGHSDWRSKADSTISAFFSTLKKVPGRLPLMMTALDAALSEPIQLIIAGGREAPETQALLNQIHRRFLPNRTILLADGGKLQQRLQAERPELASMKSLNGKATLYLCRNFVCKLPTADPSQAARLLDEAARVKVADPSDSPPSRNR